MVWVFYIVFICLFLYFKTGFLCRFGAYPGTHCSDYLGLKLKYIHLLSLLSVWIKVVHHHCLTSFIVNNQNILHRWYVHRLNWSKKYHQLRFSAKVSLHFVKLTDKTNQYSPQMPKAVLERKNKQVKMHCMSWFQNVF